MPLPDSYTNKVGAIPAYIDAMLAAEAPERFSYKFLEGLGFTSSNDRLIISILKELGFLDADGNPQDRYYQFLDRSQSEQILAEGIRDAYSDLFAVNKEAHKLDVTATFNKLRTLYKGDKKDSVIKYIARTFVALCEVADFSKSKSSSQKPKAQQPDSKSSVEWENKKTPQASPKIGMESLQYHINIVLPDTRDQAVYDAIFKSLRDHLG